MSLAFIALLPQLMAAGLATAAQIKALIASLHPGMTDPEMNAVLDFVNADATRRQALAHADHTQSTTSVPSTTL
jgi:hypothetical protein